MISSVGIAFHPTNNDMYAAKGLKRDCSRLDSRLISVYVAKTLAPISWNGGALLVRTVLNHTSNWEGCVVIIDPSVPSGKLLSLSFCFHVPAVASKLKTVTTSIGLTQFFNADITSKLNALSNEYHVYHN